MRNINTVFISPDYDVDDRLYFSDISISKEPIMREYQSLLAQEHYDDALDLIEDEDFYGSWLLNLIENRLAAIDYYIRNLIHKPDFGVYQPEEPDTDQINYIWVD